MSKGVNEYVSNTTIMWLMMLIFYQKGSLGSHHSGVSFVYNNAVNLNCVDNICQLYPRLMQIWGLLESFAS